MSVDGDAFEISKRRHHPCEKVEVSSFVPQSGGEIFKNSSRSLSIPLVQPSLRSARWQREEAPRRKVVAWSSIGYSSDDAPRNAHHPLSSHFRLSDDDSLSRSLVIFLRGASSYTSDTRVSATDKAKIAPGIYIFNISNVRKERERARGEGGEERRRRRDKRTDGGRWQSSVGRIFMLKLGDLSRKRHLSITWLKTLMALQLDFQGISRDGGGEIRNGRFLTVERHVGGW